MSTLRRFISPLIVLARLHAIAIAIGIGAGLLLMYTLAGFFLVPRIARAQLESYVTERMNRQVSIGEIRFNPFAFDASVAGLSLREADGSSLVSFRHLYVNAELASLWQRAVMLKEVQLSAPSVDLLVGDDGRVNLAQLVPESEAAPAGEESSPPRVRIGRLAVTQGRIGLVDNSREQPFSATVAPVRFTLEDFRTDVGYENAYEFAGTTLAGEQLEWSGQFTVQPLGSTGRFSVRDLKAATLDSYAATTLPFELASGQASLSGNYRFALAPTLALDLALPLLQIRDVCVKERRGTDATPVELAEVELHEVVLSYEKRDVGAKRVDVKGAHVEVAKQADGSISSSLLPVSETDQLNQLAKALIERPQLRLSVPLTVVTAKDSDAMARVALAGKLPPGAAEPPADEAAKRMRVVALEKIYKDTLKAAPAYLEQTETDDGIDVDARLQFLERALLDGLRPDDAALTSLAQQRARAVQDTLLAHTELSPERVFITAERSEGKSEGNSVRMEMKLE